MTASDMVSEIIPVDFTLSSEEEVTFVVKKLRDLSKFDNMDRDKIEEEAVTRITRSTFCANFVKLYSDNDELQLRKDMSYLVGKVSYYLQLRKCKSKARIALMESGIAELLITECDTCTDTEVMIFISITLLNIASTNLNLQHNLVQKGVISVIPGVIEKWSKRDERVVREVVGMLCNLTAGHVDIKEQIATGNSNMPAVLTGLLYNSNDKEVLEATVDCITNFLTYTMKLYEHFPTQQLMDSCFRLLQSDFALSKNCKNKILRAIVLGITSHNPQKVTKLLANHVAFLRELAVLGESTALSVIAADIINKYCVGVKHECRVISSFALLNILKFVLLYIVDIVLDIQIGIKSIKNADDNVSTRYEGCGILLFSIIPLFYINYQSISTFYWYCFNGVSTDLVLSLQGSSSGQYLKFLMPWKWDSVKHAVCNILTVLQLHPVITAIQLAKHSRQTMSDLIAKKFNFSRLTIQEKILENVPCTLIKMIILYKTINYPLILDNYVTIFSTVFGITSLTYKFSSFENLCRAANDSRVCSTLTKLQTCLVYMGNFTAIISRIMMCFILYIMTRDMKMTWIFAASIGLHLAITAIIHLSARHKLFSPYRGISSEIKCVTWDYLLTEGGFDNSITVKLGRLALILCLSWSEGFLINLRHPVELLSSHNPHTDHLRSAMYFFSLYMFHLMEVIFVAVLGSISELEAHITWIKYLTYVSVTLYMISGIMFVIFFTVKKTKLFSANVNPRFKHIGYSFMVSQEYQFCHVTPKLKKIINKSKVRPSCDYNYRLQIMNPCFPCLLQDKSHVHSKTHNQKQRYSPKGFTERFGCFVTRQFNIRHEVLHSSDADNSSIEQLIRCTNRHEVNWLIKKVRYYDNVHEHLLQFFPGIESIVGIDNRLIKTCRDLCKFRSVQDITEDELSPGIADYCNKLKGKVEILYETLTQEINEISFYDFENFQRVCEDYFFQKEVLWEEKCLFWCEIAPNEILIKYDHSEWSTNECKKEIKKWVEKETYTGCNKLSRFRINGKEATIKCEQEQIQETLNTTTDNTSYNSSNINKPSVTREGKHSTFHINGEKTSDVVHWLTIRWRNLTNCYHNNMNCP